MHSTLPPLKMSLFVAEIRRCVAYVIWVSFLDTGPQAGRGVTMDLFSAGLNLPKKKTNKQRGSSFTIFWCDKECTEPSGCSRLTGRKKRKYPRAFTEPEYSNSHMVGRTSRYTVPTSYKNVCERWPGNSEQEFPIKTFSVPTVRNGNATLFSCLRVSFRP